MDTWEQGDISGMRGVAHRLDLRHCGDTGDRRYKEEVGDLAQPGVLADIDPARQISDLVYGRYQERNVELFNVNLGSYPDDPSHPVRSCAMVTFAAEFPRIHVGPHTRMSRLALTRNRQWLDFAPASFRDRYEVEAPDNATARAVLSDDLMEWLAGVTDDIPLDLEGGALLAHVPRLGEEDPAWEALLEHVVGVHRRIPNQAWADYSPFGFLA